MSRKNPIRVVVRLRSRKVEGEMIRSRSEVENRGRCVFCRGEASEGLRLKELLICRECEARLIEVEPGDLYYDYYLDLIRGFLSPLLFEMNIN